MSAHGQPPLPREHGAWGILLVPFFAAVGVAGRWNWPVTLLLVSVLAFYVARTSWLKRQWHWVAGLLALSAAAATPLVVVWQLWWLPVFALVGAVLAARPTRPSVTGQLLGAAGLTLTAPAAWYAATGELDQTARWLWLLNALYFGGGIFYVRMHLRAALQRKVLTGLGERVAVGRSNLVWHCGAALVVIGLAAAGHIGWRVSWAFVPMLVRALVGTLRLRPPLRIKRLGWTEVAYSLLFAALLVTAFQAG